jgi:hypothetical protein
MKKEFNLDTVQEMKRPDYKKQFKKMAKWKKAKGVIILVDYKLDGKKSSIAIPYKKKPIMLKELKKIKADKIHLLKKTALCSFNVNKNKEGKLVAEISIMKGGLNPGLLKEKMTPVFGSIDLDINVLGLEEKLQSSDSTEEKSADIPNKKEDNQALILSAKQSFQFIKDFLIPNFKTGNLDEEDLLDLNSHEIIFKDFVDLFPNLNKEQQEKLGKLKDSIEKIFGQISKIKSALDGTNKDLENDLVFNKLKSMAKDIEKKTKKIKKTVLKNLRKEKTKPRDLEVLDDVLEMVNEFEFNFESTVDSVKEKVSKFYEKLQSKLKPQLEDLHKKVEATSPQKIAETAENKKLKLRYATIDDKVQEMKVKIDKLLEAVKEEEKNAPKQEPLPEGDDFVNSLS